MSPEVLAFAVPAAVVPLLLSEALVFVASSVVVSLSFVFKGISISENISVLEERTLYSLAVPLIVAPSFVKSYTTVQLLPKLKILLAVPYNTNIASFIPKLSWSVIALVSPGLPKTTTFIFVDSRDFSAIIAFPLTDKRCKFVYPEKNSESIVIDLP